MDVGLRLVFAVFVFVLVLVFVFVFVLVFVFVILDFAVGVDRGKKPATSLGHNVHCYRHYLYHSFSFCAHDFP